MNKFKLIKSFPTPHEVGVGELVITRDGYARFGTNMTQPLERVKIEYSDIQCIELSGFEFVGYNNNNRKNYAYQEWQLIFEK